jgi:5-methylcytosine-specific restriction endonuclease McrA
MKPLKSIISKIKSIDLRRGEPVAAERITGRKLVRIRERIILRDGAACRICGKMIGRLEVDHITPLHLGGNEGSDANRQLLCRDCHRAKTEREGKSRNILY